jgi:hypothetical protein
MIVFANGASKSGSTWMYRMLRLMRPWEPIPERYRHPNVEDWLNPRHYGEFVRRYAEEPTSYLTKCHVYDQKTRDLFLEHDGVFVYIISRDVQDVLVSHYFHLMREGKMRGSFSGYYWTVGRYKALQMKRYDELWSVDHERVMRATFEELKEDTAGQIVKLARHIGVNLDASTTQEIREKTSLETLRRETDEDHLPEEKRFFRKGIPGEGRRYLSERMKSDLSDIRAGRISQAFKAIYALQFEVRPRLKATVLTRSKTLGRIVDRF